MDLIQSIKKADFNKKELQNLLEASDELTEKKLQEIAIQTLKENYGEKVYYRGLLEFSNLCRNDCYYCGIRKSNPKVQRYTLTEKEILETAIWCAETGYGSIVLQSGERTDCEFVDFVEHILKRIKKVTISEKLPQGLGITLSIGEQTKETYQRFFEAGAHRYLLRIETTNPQLFAKIHPHGQTLKNRVQCLKILKKIGYQVGTGVMIGLPNQTMEDLANDLFFLKEINADMVGMGPYLIHQETPMQIETFAQKEKLKLTLKMIALARIFLQDVNIASTTALQAIHPQGRELGLQYGANIVMPLVTPSNVRKNYQLYNGKPCLDEQASDCRNCLQKRIESVGRTVGWNAWGDSKHYLKNDAKNT